MMNNIFFSQFVLTTSVSSYYKTNLISALVTHSLREAVKIK